MTDPRSPFRTPPTLSFGVWIPVLLLLLSFATIAGGSGAPKKSWPRAVKKAFNTIKTKECYDHVAVLASEGYEGRAAGEPGGRLASEYIAERFIESGLAPGGPDGSFFQRFPILLRKGRAGELAESNFLRIFKEGSKRDNYDLYDDLIPVDLSGEIATGGSLFYLTEKAAAEGTLPAGVRGNLVVLSTATLAAERSRELGAPPSGREQGIVDDDAEAPSGPRPFGRLAAAGARALLVVTDDKAAKKFPTDGWPTGSVGTSSALPVIRLTAKASEKLLRKGGTKLAKAEKGSKVNFKEWKAFLSVSRQGHPYGLGRNVIGMLPGTDPKLAEEMVVIGAHFDHVGFPSNPQLTRGKVGELHNGADDNGSGTSGLIELSEAFATQPKVERARTLIFIAFDAEELGLVGSNYYVANCPHDITKTVAMLNMDMISRNGAQEMFYGKVNRFQGLNRLVEGVGDFFDIHLDRTGMDKYMDRSDQAAFIAAGIPAVFLYGGDHPQYHTQDDDVERINPIKIQNIARFMFLCAYECANHRGSFGAE